MNKTYKQSLHDKLDKVSNELNILMNIPYSQITPKMLARVMFLLDKKLFFISVIASLEDEEIVEEINTIEEIESEIAVTKEEILTRIEEINHDLKEVTQLSNGDETYVDDLLEELTELTKRRDDCK